jgi:nitronate monooxygenase
LVISTALTNRLDIEHPVLLAPMGDVAGGALAAAVSRAGGLGLIGGGYADPAWIRTQFDLAGDTRVGVGFITFALQQQPDALAVALERNPAAVWLSFGDPAPFAPAIHDAGAALICQVQRRDEAVRAVERGADIIVAQGQDSGGHGRSGRGTMALVPAVVDAVAPVPVVAAGGIGDGRGLAAAVMLGAAGVALGTRFLASTEAISDPVADDLLVSRGGDDTTRTEAFDIVRGPAWPPGCDGRALQNRLTDQWDSRPVEGPELERLRSLYREAPPRDYTLRVLWAGETLDQVDAVEPAGVLLARIVVDAEGLLRHADVCCSDSGGAR